MTHTPRVLTLEFQFHVPAGLRRDIRTARIDRAVDHLRGLVTGAAAHVFPWADRIVVRRSWDYRWDEGTEVVALPATEDNTVAAEPADPAPAQ